MHRVLLQLTLPMVRASFTPDPEPFFEQPGDAQWMADTLSSGACGTLVNACRRQAGTTA